MNNLPRWLPFSFPTIERMLLFISFVTRSFETSIQLKDTCHYHRCLKNKMKREKNTISISAVHGLIIADDSLWWFWCEKMVFILRTIKLALYGTAKHIINIFRGNHTPLLIYSWHPQKNNPQLLQNETWGLLRKKNSALLKTVNNKFIM